MNGMFYDTFFEEFLHTSHFIKTVCLYSESLQNHMQYLCFNLLLFVFVIQRNFYSIKRFSKKEKIFLTLSLLGTELEVTRVQN
jgi:hypothetical protein